MNKKLVCLVLAFMMIFALVLSSCSINSTGNGEVSDTSEEDVDFLSRTPYTLTLWLPGEATDEAVLEVQNALNDILKPNYTTAIELRVISEDEYDSVLEAQIEKLEQKRRDDEAAESVSKELGTGAGSPSTETAADTEVETIVDENLGLSELKYPAVGEYQFDIFLITSYDTYLDYIDRVAIESLQENLESDSKVLNTYIYPTFLNAAYYAEEEIYAIPNNHGFGDMKFLLLNRDLVREFDYDEENLVGSIANCEEFIRDVAELWCPDHPETAPLLSWVDPVGMTYWSDNGEWSALASIAGIESGFDTYAPITSIFQNAEYKANFKLMKEFQEAGMIAEDPDNVESFAVGVVSADSIESVEALYGEDYIISTYDVPRATQEDVFAGAFAVSMWHKENALDRAMEIITAINTKSEVRNLLQYGVEGVHYRKTDDGLVERILDENGKSPYKMNILATGNTYMAYPEEGMPADQWEHDKFRNRMSIVSPYLYVPGLRNSENERNFAEIEKLSADLYKRLMAVSLEDVDDFFAEADQELMGNEFFAQMVNGSWEYGVSYIYNKFYDENFAPDDDGEGEGEGNEGGEDVGGGEEAGGEEAGE